jgi:short-subunit dehydrogenase
MKPGKILIILIILFILGPIIVKLIKIAYISLIPGKDLLKRYGDNSYVMITGASSGQGKVIAEEFAKQNFNIIIIGSNKSYNVQKELKNKYNIDVIVIERDFSKSMNLDWFDGIEELFVKYDISVLVNNVGQRSASNPSHLQKDENIRKSLITGTYPQIKLTNLALKYMLKRNKKSGIIFNTAQCMYTPYLFSQYFGLGEISVPYLSVYEATNAFGFYHANSIIKEYPDIDMINIMPGAVITENTQYLKSTPFACDVNVFGKNIVRLLGNYRGPTCAYWLHDLSTVLIGLFPFAKDYILKNVGLTIHENLNIK